MNETPTTITFHAEVQKAQTLADGGIRITLDLPETAGLAMMQLVECKRVGAYLSIEATPTNSLDD